MMAQIKPILIGLHGKARAGKDTVANMMIEDHGFKKYSMAAPLKGACNTLFGWDERHAEGDLKEVADPYWGFSPRHAYQTLGTEWARKMLRDDIWTIMAEKFIKENPFVVIADIRFDNEAELILRNGGHLVHIVRENNPGITLTQHASEAGLSQKYMQHCTALYNNDTIARLRVDVEDIIDFKFAGDMSHSEIAGLRSLGVIV